MIDGYMLVWSDGKPIEQRQPITSASELSAGIEDTDDATPSKETVKAWLDHIVGCPAALAKTAEYSVWLFKGDAPQAVRLSPRRLGYSRDAVESWSCVRAVTSEGSPEPARD